MFSHFRCSLARLLVRSVPNFSGDTLSAVADNTRRLGPQEKPDFGALMPALAVAPKIDVTTAADIPTIPSCRALSDPTVPVEIDA
jgi:hypothetical protein